MNLRHICGALVILFAVGVAYGQTPPDLKEDEELLKKSQLPVEGPGLLDFFRQRTLSDAEIKKLDQLILKLGDNDFAVRQVAADALTKAGPAALPILRQSATDPDQEVARLVKQCMDTIENGPNTANAVASAHLIMARRPPDAAGVLLAYLPFVDNEDVNEAVIAALLSVGIKGPRVENAVLKAIDDAKPVKRAAAALVVGRSGTAEQRQQVKKLLSDPAPEIRLRAAQGLAAAHDKSGVPTLVALLMEAPAPIAYQAEDLLQRMAGERMPAVAYDSEKRQPCRAAWEEWWKKENAALDLSKADVDPLGRSPANQAKKLAKEFLEMFFRGKEVDAKKIIGVPFQVSTHETIADYKEFEEKIGRESKDAQKLGIQFEVKGALTLAEYEKSPTANKEFLAKIDKRQLHLAQVELSPTGKKGKKAICIFVKGAGSRARIIGLVETEPRP